MGSVMDSRYWTCPDCFRQFDWENDNAPQKHKCLERNKMPQKLFDTYEAVTNMKACMKKPIVVHCLKMDEPFRVASLEGNYKQGKAGDYLMRGVDGELYICDGDIFERTYDLV